MGAISRRCRFKQASKQARVLTNFDTYTWGTNTSGVVGGGVSVRVSRQVTLTWRRPSAVLLTTSMTGQGREPKDTVSEVALVCQACTTAAACMSNM